MHEVKCVKAKNKNESLRGNTINQELGARAAPNSNQLY